MACTKQITVSIENLLWYNRRNKIGHDNSVKQNTYLSYYKWHRYWHAFRQRAPQQPIDVDLSSWTGWTASFVVTPWMSYTLDSLPQWTKIVKSNGSYYLKYNETTIWEIVSTSTAPYFFDDIVLTRGQSTIQIGNTPVVLENWDEIDVSYSTDSNNYLCFTANTAGSTVKLNKNSSLTPPILETSYNGWNWKIYTFWDIITLTNVWDKVYWRNTSTTDTGLWTTGWSYYKFVMTWSIAWSWNVSYLLNKNSTTAVSGWCFNKLFSLCASLTSAPELPARTLAESCYSSMFDNCTWLTSAPALPATTLAQSCYSHMFNWCTWLTTAPNLPATTLPDYCYYDMFLNCRWLITWPTISATTIWYRSCEEMFKWCTSLTTIPSFNITNVGAYGFYYMFNGCTSLTTAPALPATTLAQNCYVWMFSWCTALTTTPRLPATTLDSWCYANMFENCSNLTIVSTISARTLADNCCQAMFKNCTSLTTAPALPATTIGRYCYYEMFKWCTSLVTAPNLPATTLDDSCYQGMFQDCTSLTTPSRLPATTTASWCYANMYRWCTSLNKLPALPATTFGSYSYNRMFEWCSNIRMSETQDWTYTNAYRIPTTWTWWETWYSLTNMFGNTWWTFGGTPEINTTYYTSNAIVS